MKKYAKIIITVSFISSLSVNTLSASANETTTTKSSTTQSLNSVLPNNAVNYSDNSESVQDYFKKGAKQDRAGWWSAKNKANRALASEHSGFGGRHKYSNGRYFKPQELPADLRQYAIDPESVGLTYGSNKGWSKVISYGQNVDFVTTLVQNMWEKDKQKLTFSFNGTASDVVPNLATRLGISATSNPSRGAVFATSTAKGDAHTGIVSHVFTDGSMLILETNIVGYSGDAIKKDATWNYRIVSANETARWLYISPIGADYKLSANLKMLA